MNNNNRGNNRRRGRSNNRPQGGSGGGGGQQLNRIDSRARGNAPQLLEKYRKLAQDAHLNGDRVTAEYYLQFADHYFRVLADGRQRQDEQKSPRSGSWQDGEEQDGDNGEETMDPDFPSFEAQDRSQERPRRDRDDRPQQQDRPERAERAERQDRPERAERAPQQERAERPRREEPVPAQAARDEDAAEAGSEGAEGERNPYEPPENPFVRENRGTRGLRPRREDRRPRRDVGEDDAGDSSAAGLDPASLPPAIGAPREVVAQVQADDGEADAKPRRRAPRRKPSADDAGETLENVN